MAEADIVRLSFFVSILAVIALWEIMAPRRVLSDSKRRRWFTNLGMVAIDTAVIRFLLPILPVGMAITAGERGMGILNTLHLPLWSKVLVAVVALDFVIYLQHVLFHFVPIFWRLHRMHHTDLDIDVSIPLKF